MLYKVSNDSYKEKKSSLSRRLSMRYRALYIQLFHKLGSIH